MDMIRTIHTDEIIQTISQMCIKANHYLSPDMDDAMKKAVLKEKSELGQKILNQLQENLKIFPSFSIEKLLDTQ